MNIQFLFGEETLTLPPAAAKEARLAERRRKAKQCYLATSEAWKRATYRIAVEEFLPTHETFLFEELSTFYNALVRSRPLPATVNGKAFAGLQRILINEGKIELIKGFTRVRSNGQQGLLYRSVLFQAFS